jgi:hypothetical protein
MVYYLGGIVGVTGIGMERVYDRWIVLSRHGIEVCWRRNGLWERGMPLRMRTSGIPLKLMKIDRRFKWRCSKIVCR